MEVKAAGRSYLARTGSRRTSFGGTNSPYQNTRLKNLVDTKCCERRNVTTDGCRESVGDETEQGPLDKSESLMSDTMIGNCIYRGNRNGRWTTAIGLRIINGARKAVGGLGGDTHVGWPIQVPPDIVILNRFCGLHTKSRYTPLWHCGEHIGHAKLNRDNAENSAGSATTRCYRRFSMTSKS